MRRALGVLALAGLTGCNWGGPLRDAIAGEGRPGQDVVDAKKTVALGSKKPLACEVRWKDASIHLKILGTVTFAPAAGGPTQQLFGSEKILRESNGSWVIHVDTDKGWAAGTYTCDFSMRVGDRQSKRSAKIVVK